MIRRAAAIVCASLLTAGCTSAERAGDFAKDCRSEALSLQQREAACRSALAQHSLTDQDAGLLNELALVLARQSRETEALQVTDQAIALSPNAWIIKHNRAIILGNIGRYDEALAVLAQLIAERPNEIELYRARADVYRHADRLDEALADLDKVLVPLPDDQDAYDARIDVRLRQHEFDEAIAAADKGERAYRDAGARANEQCWTRAVANRELDRAGTYCNQALAVSSKPGWLDSRALVHLRRGEFKDALADYDAALKIDPRAPHILYARGVTKLRLGDAEGGRADTDAAAALAPYVVTDMRELGIAP